MKSPDQGSGVMYVNFKTERFLFSDNRRGMRFFLIDSTGKSQLAVLGEERDTRYVARSVCFGARALY